MSEGLAGQMLSPCEQLRVAGLWGIFGLMFGRAPVLVLSPWHGCQVAEHLPCHALAPTLAPDWLVTCLDHLHSQAPQCFKASCQTVQPKTEQHSATAAPCCLQVSASALQEFEAKMAEEQEKKQQQQEQQAQKPQQQQETQGQPQNQEGDAAEGGQPGEQMKPEVGLRAAKPSEHRAGC